VEIDVDVEAAPDYLSRRIWYGYGTWDYNSEPYRQWCARNRATAGIALNTGHAYGRIIAARQAEFDAHPEYYALVDGERLIRSQAKLCISNPDLRELVADYAREYFERKPEADSI